MINTASNTIETTITLSTDGCEEDVTVTCSPESIHNAAHNALDEWMSDGDWGVDACTIDCGYTLTDEDGYEEFFSSEWEFEGDEDALMRAAGLDSDCEHEWTAPHDIVGGCKENPGVISLGGTSIQYHEVCECGAHRHEIFRGSQRNPGEAERSVTYELGA